MSCKTPRLSFPIFFSCIVLFLLAQYEVRHFIEKGGGRIVLENRNELSSLSRLQCAAEQSGEVIVLGSSQTERLIPGNGVVCIGVPGSSFQAGLKFVNPALLRPGTVVVIEANHILSGESGLMKDTHKLLFKLGMKIRPLALASRPSALLVSLLQHLKYRGQYEAQQQAAPFDVQSYPVEAEVPGETGRAEKIEAVVRDIRQIQKTGARVMIAVFPTKHNRSIEDIQSHQEVIRLAVRAGVPVFDYTGVELTRQLSFQDEVHLVPTALSTFRFRNTLARDAKMLLRSAVNGDK